MNSDELQQKFDHEWGRFRRFIAKNPLTGYWTGVATPFVIGGVVSIIRAIVPGI